MRDQIFFFVYANLLSVLALTFKKAGHAGKTHSQESAEAVLAPTLRPSHQQSIRQKQHRYTHTVSESACTQRPRVLSSPHWPVQCDE